MVTNIHFWSLVRHDIKLQRVRQSLARKWKRAYITIFAILVIALTTYGSQRIQLDLNNTWYFSFWFPFMVFGFAAGRIGHEWKNGTAGWWLSLPVSRQRLVASKFVATLVQSVLIFALVYFAVAILGLYTMALKGSLHPQEAVVFLTTGLRWNAILICICPLAAAFGVLFGVMKQTHARPGMPLIWIGLGGTWWLLSQDNHFHTTFMKWDLNITITPLSCLVILTSWMSAYLLVRLSSYLLEKQLTL